jgi:chemotaxis protein methyltransferase WspC
MTRPEQTRAVEVLLAERIGLDPETVGAGAIARALDARRSALGLKDRDTYLQLLSGSEDEQQELIEEVVIPESWFFRDEHPFAVLRTYVKASVTSPLRVLSIPCACGEEPYSIAITLLELGLSPGHFQIDAVDISARHLALAERGIYRAHSFRGSDLSFRQRYFQPSAHAQSFTLDARVRATVRFHRGNLLDPHLLSGQPPYEVIFCRNLLIYLDAAARRCAMAALDRLLDRKGLVFVGHADRLSVEGSGFERWGEHASFALRRASASATAAKAPRRPLTASGAGVAIDPALRQARPPSRAVPAQGALRPLPPTPTPTAIPIPIPHASLPESSATLLDEAAALADQGRHAEAAARCEAALARFGPSARAFYLLGLIRQAGGDLAEAESLLRKTIYLDPAHDEALLALALLAQRRGDQRAATGYRLRADRARARKGPS